MTDSTIQATSGVCEIVKIEQMMIISGDEKVRLHLRYEGGKLIKWEILPLNGGGKFQFCMTDPNRIIRVIKAIELAASVVADRIKDNMIEIQQRERTDGFKKQEEF